MKQFYVYKSGYIERHILANSRERADKQIQAYTLSEGNLYSYTYDRITSLQNLENSPDYWESCRDLYRSCYSLYNIATKFSPEWGL